MPLANQIGADTNRPMSDQRLHAILDTMPTHGIHLVARIVVAKDPLLGEHRA